MTKEILIVEDNEDNSLLVEKILYHHGFKTFVAPHGNAALEYCSSHQPDLILMDLSLPDIDGIEVARLLRMQAAYQNIPIIALTAHAMPEMQKRAQEAGIDDFLTKPFLPNELILLIHEQLSPNKLKNRL